MVGPRRANVVLSATGERNLSLSDEPTIPQARSIEVSSQELSLVLWGIDPTSVKRQNRYQRTGLTPEKLFLAAELFAAFGYQ